MRWRQPFHFSRIAGRTSIFHSVACQLCLWVKRIVYDSWFLDTKECFSQNIKNCGNINMICKKTRRLGKRHNKNYWEFRMNMNASYFSATKGFMKTMAFRDCSLVFGLRLPIRPAVPHPLTFSMGIRSPRPLVCCVIPYSSHPVRHTIVWLMVLSSRI